MDTLKIAVYSPSHEILPYLAVVINTDGSVHGMSFANKEDAEAFVSETGRRLEAGTTERQDKRLIN